VDAQRHGLISGRYRLGELLGSGGSASVFVATDVVTRSTVALKILHPHLSTVAPGRQAMLDAAHSSMSVRHVNVAEVLGSGIDWTGAEPLAWIAMEVAPGVSVAELVERDGPMGVDQALAMAEGVLNALEASHEAGLIHRDVSPANIMVAPSADGSLEVANVRLIDFGISLAGPTVKAAAGTLVLGNPNYASPEHAAGMPADERGDLYQVGGSLYTALTGHPPFLRGTVADVLQAHRAAPPPVPSVARPGLSRLVDRLTVKAMMKHPDDRFATAVAMRDAIRSARHSRVPAGEATRQLAEPTTVVGAPSAERSTVATVRATRRGPRARPVRPGRAGGAGAALLVGGLVTLAWLLAANSQNSPIQPASTSAPAAAPTVAPFVAPPGETTPPPPPRTAASTVVPEIEGSALADASAALTAAGLTVGALTIQHSELPGDTVLLAAIPAGSAVIRGAAVDLVVASGSNLVPPVTLLSEAAGIAAIRAAGFVAVVHRTADAVAGESVVVGTSPVAGAIGRLGDEVTLSVSRGAASPVTAPDPLATPGPTATPTPAATPAPTVEVTPPPSPERTPDT